MNNYELLFIISQDATDEKKEEIISKISDSISKVGKDLSVDKWGMKKFAYPISFKTEGYYVLMNFTCPADAISELDRQLSVNELVVRQMFVKK